MHNFNVLKFKNIGYFIFNTITNPVLYFNRTRSFHTSCLSASKPRQVGVAMRKIMGNNKKKKIHYSETSSTSPSVFTNVTAKTSIINPRRAIVLNKLFMRNITDLMSTAEYASQIIGLGVEVLKVKITHDYKILKVYWVTKSSNTEEAEEILQKNAGLLRHGLATLRLMGNVPMIQFVKDKNYGQFMELNNRLSIADYGEEGPSNVDPASYLISECVLSVPIEKTIKDEIAKLEENNPCEIEELQLPELPPMTNCVFGLDHEDIIQRVKKASSKTRCNYTGMDENWASFKLKQYSDSESLELGTAKLQREAFNKFLHQRQLLKIKERKSVNDLDVGFTEGEYEDDLKNSSFSYQEIKDEDFIVEDFEETVK